MSIEEHDERKPFDLAAAMQPVVVDLPDLGPVTLRVRSAGFLRWFDEGEANRRWGDPASFVRALLSDRTGIPDDAEASLGPRAESLTAEQVEAAAAIIVASAGDAFVPSRLRDQDDTDDVASGDAGAPLATEPGETESARLYRLARGYSEHHRRQSQRFLDAVKRANRVADLLSKTDALSSILRNQNILASGTLSERVMRQAEALPSILKVQNSLASGFLGSEAHRRALAASDRSQSMLKAADVLASSSLFEGHRRLAEQLATNGSPLSRLQESVRGMTGLRAWQTAEERSRLFSSRALWSETVNKQLRLGLPATLFTSLAAQLAGTAMGGVPPELATMIRPGYEAVATVALEGLAGPGAAAELLRRYGEEGQAPILEAVRQTVIQLDAEDAGFETFMSAYEAAWTAIMQAIASTPDLIRKPAFAVWLGVLISVGALALSGYQVFGPPPVEITSRMDRTNDELRGINDKLETESRSDEAARHIRYVETVVNLRVEPDVRALSIRFVYPDQWVRVLETRGEWAKVEVFDYGTDAPVTGWVSRRYLRNRAH
ncbi:MAG TPA: SH3 domain-containing protein [Allosphingosinicella sp.]|uniref:SH3 domain-containing protein n=1 Tax=Allosphingosinicella sp. TaxID=2823234 RepID=UPI002F26ECA5